MVIYFIFKCEKNNAINGPSGISRTAQLPVLLLYIVTWER